MHQHAATAPLPNVAASDRKRLARAMHERRVDFARALYQAAIQSAGADPSTHPPFDQAVEWIQSQTLTAIDTLRQWFVTRNALFLELFEGWVGSRMPVEVFRWNVPAGYQPARVVEQALAAWAVLLPPHRPAEGFRLLRQDLETSIDRLSAPVTKRPGVLFIGDCIHFDVVTAMLGPCARDGIEVRPTLISERVPALLRNALRGLAPEQFQLVFFSPFSHAFFTEYAALLNPKATFWSTRRRSACLAVLLDEVRATIQMLVDRFDCPVYVHNTAATVQSVGHWSGAVKNVATWRARAAARRTINATLAGWVDDPEFNAVGRVHLLDENALRATTSTVALGRVYFQSGAFHPTRLGIMLGRGGYYEAVYAAAHLASKKVVVCDLDNTLWDGVIGEGQVSHYVGRQDVLKELRRRGVLLSIASKNDPRNVQWHGARLTPDDFVAPQISWDAKATSIGRIRDQLNLRTKDFVFLDDRPDELERVRAAFPDVHVMDATQDHTWRVLAEWQRQLPRDPDEDRTRLYHERVRREHFIKCDDPDGIAPTAAPEDEAAALAGLKLVVTLRPAGRADLKRAAELINRTNQFNLCGSRTTARELQVRIAAGGVVMLAEAGDRFGQMGVVGVMVLELSPGQVDVPVFVLSCRVFGFGIEQALLNSVRRLIPSTTRLVGHYQQTQSNEPCRQMYSRAGLAWDGQRWVGLVSDLPPDAAWLDVRMTPPEHQLL